MQQAASFIVFFLSVYSFLIVIRIVLSWGRMGETRFGSFYRYVTILTDPYLNFFRGFPGTQRGAFDFSPIIAMIVLSIVQNILSIFAAQGSITLGLVLALITQAVWSVTSFFLILFIIIAVLRIIMEYRRSSGSIQYIAILVNLLKGTQDLVHRLIFGGREMPLRTLLIASALAPLGLYIVLRLVFSWLTTVLVQLPV
jgi:YggT family protein